MPNKKDRKKFKDTKVGVFLKEKAPKILDSIGDILPDQGAFGVVKNLISKDETLPPEDKETALKLLDLALIYLTVCMTLFIVFDSIQMIFDMKSAWIDLLQTLLVTVYVAYFGSRGAEKVFINKDKNK